MDIIAFIGGGNMAGAIIGGLRRSGRDGASIVVVDPGAAQRERLSVEFGVRTLASVEAAGAQTAPAESASAEAASAQAVSAQAALAQAGLVVWAVKPQIFHAAAAPCRQFVGGALHLSVMAGVRRDAMVRALGSERIVRAMPNTPALIGQGISGLFATDSVTAPERQQIETVLAPTGALLWVEREADLDAVTALSGSGPAYVFYVLEAMIEAARQMGLSAEQGKQLALATFAGATSLAQASRDAPEQLRAQVTSPGGTTQAALALLEASGVKPAFVAALVAAQERARALGDEFGRPPTPAP